MSQFAKANKQQARLRLALEGPAGHGKTYTALLIATELAGDGRIAYVDTEAGSAAKYADEFDFDTVALGPPFHPDRFVELIKDAEEAGHAVVVLDSLTHAWNGKGGILELVDELKRTKHRGDGRSAWRDATPIQQRLVDAILRSRIHVIGCMRTKTDHFSDEVEKDGVKRAVGRKVGMKTQQRDEFDYEFDIVGRFEQPAVLTITKSRCSGLPPAATAMDATDPRSIVEKPGAEFAKMLAAWLGSGAALPAKATPADHKKLAKLVGELDEAGKPPGQFKDGDWQAVADAYAEREFGHGLAALTKDELRLTTEALAKYLEKLKANGAGPADAPAAAPAEPQQEAMV